MTAAHTRWATQCRGTLQFNTTLKLNRALPWGQRLDAVARTTRRHIHMQARPTLENPCGPSSGELRASNCIQLRCSSFCSFPARASFSSGIAAGSQLSSLYREGVTRFLGPTSTSGFKWLCDALRAVFTMGYLIIIAACTFECIHFACPATSDPSLWHAERQQGAQQFSCASMHAPYPRLADPPDSEGTVANGYLCA